MSKRKLMGFARLSPEDRRAMASRGGKSVPPELRGFSRHPLLAASSGRKGGKASSGNFAKCPDRARECGKLGGKKRWAKAKESAHES